MTTTATALELASAYELATPLHESWRLADPSRIAQHRDLLAWPEAIAKWRGLSWDERYGHEAPALPTYNGRSVGSPQMVQSATRAAAADISQDIRARLADGQLRVIAYQEPRRLDAEPVLLPTALVAAATANWRAGTIEAGGMTFLEARAIRASDLPAAAPEAPDLVCPHVVDGPKSALPPATMPAFLEAPAGLFVEDAAWTKAGTADLAKAVASRDKRFRPHHGPARAGRWSERTLHQRIREIAVEAREEAGV